MEFNGQYLSYEEYVSLGGTLQQMPFNLLEFEARKKIDRRTQSRLYISSEIPEDVKICVFKMINAINGNLEAQEKNKNIASESIDGYSVTYSSTSIEEAIKSQNVELENIMTDMLTNVVVDGVRIIYLGVK